MTCPFHSVCNCCGRCSWCGARIDSTVALYHTLPLPTEPYWPDPYYPSPRKYSVTTDPMLPPDAWTPGTGPCAYPGTTTGNAT